ncbi:glycosyltransferase family 2 protein [archaeon]|jgi:peptidoglycan-N-acetylglucosamine deacetylase|nr:glycosyltransferase family 2 protein [archaeon]MBT3577468.1 glycosyltransferase family 2 protein [archaeon]MBT6820289.1 glycosyltransferase family 2 protein [archaeon]MBT6955986.1 glycosyltransferase family 2 protein [archaeon]MBT7025103.1 glycosyltransferase family 2 protein [archaeon]
MELISIVIYLSVYIGLVATSFYALSFFADKKKEKLLYSDDELPKTTVIIPALNEEKSVKRTLDSILASDYPKDKLEIIFVDDGSTDKTLSIAKKFQSKQVRVFTKKNGGKGSALNLAIKKSRGEVIFTMDADTFVEPHCVKEMVRYFKDKKVMSVIPSMLTHKPKGILQRIQQAEYLFGLFIRKAFSSVNAVHITPGAFSAYRKTFFDKYGGYDETNITEDLEMSLRIQYQGFTIEYAPNAPVYTIAPNKFMPLLVQRRRWYTGLMRNTWKYKGMFSPKYGDLGLFILPLAWISIFFSVFTVTYLAIKTLFRIQAELLFLSNIQFDFLSSVSINAYVIERFLFQFFTNPIVIFLLFFLVILAVYLRYAAKYVGKITGLTITLPLFFMFFALLFGFWWLISIFYVMFNRKVVWR